MDFDRLVRNHSFATVRVLPAQDRHGADVALVVAKMGYAIGPTGAVRLADVAVRLRDEHQADGSLRFPTDYIDEKPGTDVGLVGTAHPPFGRPVTEMDVALRVGLLAKTLRIHGRRVYYAGVLGVVPGVAAEIGSTPLGYGLAFGGCDDADPANPIVDQRNPLGLGFAADRARVAGRPAPRIEDPRAPLSSRNPAVAGFGPVPAHWLPRSRLAGTYDEAWRRERAPVLPEDRDPRHACWASADLWSKTALVGDEPIEVVGATPEGTWRFKLPRYELLFGSVLRGERRAHPSHLDSLLIDADERRVELTWRVAIVLPRKWQALEALEIASATNLPDEVLGETPREPARAPAEAEVPV